MYGSLASRKGYFSAAFAALILLLSVSVFSAQEAIKPPAWVGIYTTAGKVGLKWGPATGAARYRVYRSIASGKGYELIATTTDVSYIDTTARAGETYYYVLKAVTSSGTESVYSDERYITVPVTGGGVPVKPPEWVGVSMEEKQLKLTWLPSPSANALAYNVYRSREKDKGFQLIGSTQDTNLTDTEVKEGETYYYALTTLDKDFNETKFSEVRQVLYIPPKGLPTTKAPKGGELAAPEKLVVKKTRLIGYILKGKDKKPLSSPTDVALGDDGLIYISDSGSSTIQVFKPNGEYARAIGGPIEPGKEEGRFAKLIGLALDSCGDVYAVDAFTGRIQKFNSEGKLLMNKKMADDVKAISEDLGLTRLKPPQLITGFGIVKPLVSPDGVIYLLDNYNCCVEMYSANGKYLKSFGGKGITDGKLIGPTFAAFSVEGEIIVSDCMNARIQVFDKNGKFLWKFGSYGSEVGTFGRPKGVSVDSSGRIYVADSMSNVVQVFEGGGKFMYVLGDDKGKQMDLATPNGIAVDKRRRIYMVEKLINRVQVRQVGEE